MGRIIVIDGLDGSGKATQAKLLKLRLESEFIPGAMPERTIVSASFPDYNSNTSALVKMYLDGAFGMDATSINPYGAALFYTVDRAGSFYRGLMDVYRDPNSIIICDRYISANAIHQGTKLRTLEEREKFFEWLYDTEVSKVGLPMETITIILDVPVRRSKENIETRYNGNEDMKDIHEANVDYLEQCHSTMLEAVSYYQRSGKPWYRLDCMDESGNMKSVTTIHLEICNLLMEKTDVFDGGISQVLS